MREAGQGGGGEQCYTDGSKSEDKRRTQELNPTSGTCGRNVAVSEVCNFTVATYNQ